MNAPETLLLNKNNSKENEHTRKKDPQTIANTRHCAKAWPIIYYGLMPFYCRIKRTIIVFKRFYDLLLNLWHVRLIQTNYYTNAAYKLVTVVDDLRKKIISTINAVIDNLDLLFTIRLGTSQYKDVKFRVDNQ
jgi:hypothetical protein